MEIRIERFEIRPNLSDGVWFWEVPRLRQLQGNWKVEIGPLIAMHGIEAEEEVERYAYYLEMRENID